MARRVHTAFHRLRKVFGQGIVALDDAVSGQRKEIPPGTHNSNESRIECARILSKWEARGRLDDQPAAKDFTIAELLLRFMNHAVGYSGRNSKEHSHGKFERALNAPARLSRMGHSEPPCFVHTGGKLLDAEFQKTENRTILALR